MKLICVPENGIAHAGTAVQDMRASAVKPLDDMMMPATFASGERRLYDATQLPEYPAFQPLKDEAVWREDKEGEKP